MGISAKTLSIGFSIALASAFALGLAGCGPSDAGPGGAPGPGPGPAGPAPAAALPEPKAQYSFFAPRTEAELMGTYGDGQRRGRPIANYGYMVAKARQGFSPAAFAKHGLEVLGSFSAGGATYYHLHRDSDLVGTMEKARKMGGLLYIEPDIMSYTTAGIDYSNPDPAVANQFQYGALTTMARKAWETHGFGPNRPVVADIDTGVRYGHEDLAGVVRHAFSWFATNGSDPLPGGNPLADPDPVDWRAAQPGGSTDANGHGTHTAGTIAAQGNNGRGVAGMCWNVDLVSYKGLSNGGSGGDWTVYGSLWHLAKWKKENYPHTIPVNMSLGSGFVSQFEVDMIETALEHGIVVCASSGNDHSGFASFPGSITGVIRVGAVNYLDRRVGYSNWGNDMSVMAPGEDVLSTINYGDDTYTYYGGTSMAAPHVTGLAGYMLTFAPDLRPDQIRTYLERNADPIEGQKGFDPRFGHGRINAHRAIGALLADLGGAGPPPSDYAPAPVKVRVAARSGAPLNDAIVYLYNCSQDGSIANYAGLTLTGPSYVGARDDPAAAAEDGVAWFSMLRPGHYKVAANYSITDLATWETESAAAESPRFEVRGGAPAPPVALSLDIPDPMVVQTYPTGNPDRQGTDTCIDVWDAGGPLLEYDYDWFDTVTFGLSAPGTYWIRIYPYQTRYGEYALWLGNGMKPAPAPGTFDEPGPAGVRGSQSHSQPTAQAIGVNDRVVYGDLTSANRYTGDWYRFEVE